MKIAVLALQGAFAEHEAMLRRLGVETFLVRKSDHWLQHKDALVIPGGESTAQMKLLRELHLESAIRDDILQGLPVFGTCAGLILLSQSHLATMDIEDRARHPHDLHTRSLYQSCLRQGQDHGIPRWTHRSGTAGQSARHGFPSGTDRRPSPS